MRIAIIGPSHPYKGGIPQETTELAHRLKAAGHEVDLIAWQNQYPKLLYPGEQHVPQDKPEIPLFPGTRRVLNWFNPFGWWRWGRKLRGYEKVMFVWWVPRIQGPVYSVMLWAMGRAKPEIQIICHNVLRHESNFGDAWFVKHVFNHAHRIITHTDKLAETSESISSTPVTVVELPMALPGPLPLPRDKKRPLTHNLLFFGIVRPYKGLDVLLKAAAEIPAITLTVAGEFWEKEAYLNLIDELGIKERITVRDGYVPADDLPELFAGADALVLPYRGGTGSFHIKIGHMYGLPVIATTAGPLKDQLQDGVDGLQCAPDDPKALADAIRRFYEPGVAARLAAGIKRPSADEDWQKYLDAIL
jgi:glycosyltransferase involved in cell wall biosynthesis